MFCNHCGAPVSAEQTYCVRCGKSPLTNNLVVATRGRVVQHVHLLAVLWIVGGVLSFIPVPILLSLAGMSGGWHINGDFPPVLSFAGPAMFTGIAILLGIFAFANLITGWALLKMRPWGRVLALIMGLSCTVPSSIRNGARDLHAIRSAVVGLRSGV